MPPPGPPRAGLVEYFAAHAALGPSSGAAAAGLPDIATVEALIDAGFWASLQREEGYAPEISLAYLPPERAVRPLLLAAPLPLGPRALARLAPAVERPGIHLGVWREEGELRVWGTTRAIPTFCFVLEVLGPGLLVVKHRIHDDSAKFRNVAVFEGDQVKVLSRQDADASDHPALLKSLLAPDSTDAGDGSVRRADPAGHLDARAQARGHAAGRARGEPRIGGSRSSRPSPTRSSRRSPSSRTSCSRTRRRIRCAGTTRSAAWWTPSPASPRWTAPP